MQVNVEDLQNLMNVVYVMGMVSLNGRVIVMAIFQMSVVYVMVTIPHVV